MAGATWNCCCLCASSVYTIQPPTSSQCHFISSHIRRTHICLAVTCHLHFWYNDWNFLHAPAAQAGSKFDERTVPVSEAWMQSRGTQPPALLRRPLSPSVHDDHYCPVFFRPGSWTHIGQGHDACTLSTVLWTTVGSARMPAKNDEWMRCGSDKREFFHKSFFIL